MWRGLYLCMILVAQGRTEDPPSVLINQGRLKGTFLETRGGRLISVFQGIPYASPPVGPLRFKRALPPGSWEGVRDAVLPGSPCLQPNSILQKGEVIGDEDCLYLNVYTHKTSNESKFPVLVFIHGGGFTEGRGDLYQPDYLMDKDIILVTINYRLGPLGFLSMEDKELPGNNGLKDQVTALQWVRDNIAQFGGDSNSVTICGESVGAASVHYHMLSPLSRGLFHRAIAQSGSAYCPWASHAPGQLRLTSEQFAAHLGCNHHSIQDTLDCLRDMPGYVLIEIAQSMQEWHIDPVVPFTPAIEPADTEDPFMSTNPWMLTSELPLISGLTSSEGIFRVTRFDKANIVELNEDFEMIGPLTLIFRNTAEDPVHTALTIKKFYYSNGDITPDNIDGLVNMFSDSWFVYPVLESFRRHHGTKYLYYFSYRGANSIVPEYPGVSHFDDMQYFFPLQQMFIEGFGSFNESAEDRKMSEKLIDFWANFVIHGKPTLPTSDAVWQESVEGNEYLHIKNDGFTMDKDLLKERFDFWRALPYRNKYSPEAKVINEKKDEL